MDMNNPLYNIGDLVKDKESICETGVVIDLDLPEGMYKIKWINHPSPEWLTEMFLESAYA